MSDDESNDNEEFEEDKGGCTVKDVPAQDFVMAYSKHLKRQGKITPPLWVDIVKTSPAKKMCPDDEDWYFVRCASLARKIYLKPHTGIGALTRMYGGREDRGTAPERFRRSSGGILRNMLSQLEEVGVVKKEGKGRVITRVGQQDLDNIAGQVREQATA